MKRFTHLIFDLDGTLLDTIQELLFNLNKTFKELGLKGDFNEAEMASFLGSGKDEQIKRAMKARSIKDVEFSNINRVLSHYYAQNAIGKTKVFNEVLPTIAALKEKNIPLYVATNKPQEVALLVVDHFFGANTFLIIRGDYGDGIVKPNPLFLKSIVDVIGVGEHVNPLFIGDSMIDYLSAKSVGMCAAIVPHGYDASVLEVSDPRLIHLRSFKDILELVI